MFETIDYSLQPNLSVDKLRKLRDKAADHYRCLQVELTECSEYINQLDQQINLAGRK